MKKMVKEVLLPILILLIIFCFQQKVSACSNFKLQKNSELIYGHNLNQGDLGVPGMIFINKRGIFKTGRTWSELATKEAKNPSSFCWISRYGSVTFNVFGRDFPDGGMNEAGLYIWEMNEDTEYPVNDSLPKLNQMNWMQFILDSYSTLDEAVQCAFDIEIEGWGWHYFVGDAEGNCAAVAFVDGQVVIRRGQKMPVPALFNTPYDRELELLRYFKGFGGFYEPDMDDPEIPRFVKTAVMIRDYDPTEDAIEYAFRMLDNLKVYDVPEWSVIFDVSRKDVYFKTRINPAIKKFSMKNLDFSNQTQVSILDMDTKSGGDVQSLFHSYSNEEMRRFLQTRVITVLPAEFFTSGGLSLDEYLDRFSSHSDAGALKKNQFFRGTWKGMTGKAQEKREMTVILNAKGDAVSGTISIMPEGELWYELDHLRLIGERLEFTYRKKDHRIFEAKASIRGDDMNVVLTGIEDNLGSFNLKKQEL